MLTPGEIFKKRREALRKSIYSVSLETKIGTKYIEMLEENRYNEFDSPVFANGFVKIYSEYLGLDQEKMVALYRRENTDFNPSSTIKNIKDKRGEKQPFIQKYKNIIIQAIIVILTIALIAISIILNNSKPKEEALDFELLNIQDGYVTKESSITLEGNITQSYMLYINSTLVPVSNGSFKYQYSLVDGDNKAIIEIKNKDNNLIKQEIISIKKEKTIVQQPPIENNSDGYEVYIQIKDASTWITMSVDDKQEIAQALNPGKTDKYKITKTLTVVSGKPLNTSVYINNKLYNLVVNTQSGTGSLNCSINNNQIECMK